MRGVAALYNSYMLVFGKSGAVRLWSSSGRCLDSRSSCVFGEGMQMSFVLLMLVIFDGFLIFQFIDSCFGSFLVVFSTMRQLWCLGLLFWKRK